MFDYQAEPGIIRSIDGLSIEGVGEVRVRLLLALAIILVLVLVIEPAQLAARTT